MPGSATSREAHLGARLQLGDAATAATPPLADAAGPKADAVVQGFGLQVDAEAPGPRESNGVSISGVSIFVAILL